MTDYAMTDYAMTDYAAGFRNSSRYDRQCINPNYGEGPTPMIAASADPSERPARVAVIADRHFANDFNHVELFFGKDRASLTVTEAKRLRDQLDTAIDIAAEENRARDAYVAEAKRKEERERIAKEAEAKTRNDLNRAKRRAPGPCEVDTYRTAGTGRPCVISCRPSDGQFFYDYGDVDGGPHPGTPGRDWTATGDIGDPIPARVAMWNRLARAAGITFQLAGGAR